MNDTIIIDGVKYRRVEEETKPKTGYERVDEGVEYYYNSNGIECFCYADMDNGLDDELYSAANYYNDKSIAKNNARADTLMRRLRQWQALNDAPVDWGNDNHKYYIYFSCEERQFGINSNRKCHRLGSIYFSSEEKAFEAVNAFHDELLWYFTEYQQRLDEPKRG